MPLPRSAGLDAPDFTALKREYKHTGYYSVSLQRGNVHIQTYVDAFYPMLY